jgi:hypothetical protein
MKLRCLALFHLKSCCERKTKFECMFDFFEFENSNFVNVLEWRNLQYESCVSLRIIKLSILQCFHLNPFAIFI